jgi:hypothetical protein
LMENETWFVYILGGVRERGSFRTHKEFNRAGSWVQLGGWVIRKQ